jgi:hypothetical protein
MLEAIKLSDARAKVADSPENRCLSLAERLTDMLNTKIAADPFAPEWRVPLDYYDYSQTPSLGLTAWPTGTRCPVPIKSNHGALEVDAEQIVRERFEAKGYACSVGPAPDRSRQPEFIVVTPFAKTL